MCVIPCLLSAWSPRVGFTNFLYYYYKRSDAFIFPSLIKLRADGLSIWLYVSYIGMVPRTAEGRSLVCLALRQFDSHSTEKTEGSFVYLALRQFQWHGTENS